MQKFKIVLHIAVLTIFYYTGVFIQRIFEWMIPGSIIGMVLLFLALRSGLLKVEWVSEGAKLLMKHLPLLFVPVTVGVIEYLYVFSGRGIFLFLIALVSTLMVMVITGKISQERALRKEQKYE